jgi:hypothetical protein
VADRGLRDRLATAQARYLLLDGRGGEALGIASAVLAHEPADEETRARATTMAAWALVQAGRANQAVATIAQQGYLGAESGKERPWLSDVDWVLCAAYVILGRFAEAETIAAAAYQRSVSSHWALGVWDSAFTLTIVALARGRVRTAVRWVLEGLAQISEAGDATVRHFELVQPLVLAGDLDDAEEAFRAADVARIERSRLWLLAVEQARWWIAAGRATCPAPSSGRSRRRPGRIAGLAAAGLSNRAIAERLVVSVRTVDNHLQHVFDKLGIRSRQELSRFMGDHNQAATVE